MGESYAWLNDGKLNMVKCHVCTQIEIKKKICFPPLVGYKNKPMSTNAKL
jgi:hypothetical protein